MSYANPEWKKQVVSWEYSVAATPNLKGVPIQPFPASLHESGETRIIELDLSTQLNTPYPATAPALLANYVRICMGENIRTEASSSSEVFFVLRGAGRSEVGEETIEWKQGDAFTLPSNGGAEHFADADTALLWVHDGPLLNYLGARPNTPRFAPAYYAREYMQAEIERIREIGIRENRNRVGIILGNEVCKDTKTITHSMWSLFNLLPAGAVQKPHRHQSVAIDLAVFSGPDTYTLIAEKVDEEGQLINPVRADWGTSSVFVTPPGWWHSHHNESDQDAYVFPVQDAGLHTYLRTLDIRFIR